MSDETRKRDLEITWPLFDDGGPARAFSADPSQAVHDFAPAPQELERLEQHTAFVDAPERAAAERARLRETLPPSAPEWMRAARALANAMDGLIQRGTVDAVEQAAIARAWAAWSLGGVSEAYVLRVAHLVSRAHAALRDSARAQVDLQAAYQAAAGVLHSGLPSVLRQRMPFERAMYVVRRLREQPDAWAAVVEATSELLGWRDYAESHAAAVIRAVIERAD